MDDEKYNIVKIVFWHFEFDQIKSAEKEIFRIANRDIEYLNVEFEDCLCLCPNIIMRDDAIAFCNFAAEKYLSASASRFYMYLHSDYRELSQSGRDIIEAAVSQNILKRYKSDTMPVCNAVIFGKSSGELNVNAGSRNAPQDSKVVDPVYRELIHPVRVAFGIQQ